MRQKRTLATGEEVEALEDLGEKMYTEDEFKRLIAATDKTFRSTLHEENYITLSLFGWCGPRTMELKGVYPEDINLEKQELKIFTLKQKEERKGIIRTVPIPAFLIPKLRKYLKKKMPGESIFTWCDGSMRYRMRGICKIANVPYKGLKGLRHRFGSHFAPYFETHELAKLMGHRNPSTVMIYYHANPDIMKKKYEKAMAF
jgi:integrase